MIAAQFERLKNGNKGHVRLTAPSSRYLKVIEEMPEAVITALQTHRGRMVTSLDC